MPFIDEQEFYSDFNDYDVTVRAPANYVVWGTGTLRNAATVLQPDAARRFRCLADRPTPPFTSPPRPTCRGTLRHRAGRGQQLALHRQQRARRDLRAERPLCVGRRRAWSWTTPPTAEPVCRRPSTIPPPTIHHMVSFGRHALDWLSHNWPGVPYPYEKTTVVPGLRRHGIPDDGERRIVTPTRHFPSSWPSMRSRTRGSRSTWGSTSRATASWTKDGPPRSST